jgi:DNA gyrase inhibitor GyrI
MRAILLMVLLPGCAMFQRVDEPPFRTVEVRGDVEIRAYEAMVLAVTDVEGERKASLYAGFRLLADYIFGKNQQARSVSMTAPVQQQAASRALAMTAPVQQSGGGGTWRVSFVMPRGETLETLPRPVDDRVRLVEVPARQVAALRYRGTWNHSRTDENTRTLLDTVEKMGLKPVGEPVSAKYDPPWTPFFLRRNEVLVDVVPRDATHGSAPTTTSHQPVATGADGPTPGPGPTT